MLNNQSLKSQKLVVKMCLEIFENLKNHPHFLHLSTPMVFRFQELMTRYANPRTAGERFPSPPPLFFCG